ncbi:Acyl-phosphate:glycerol-3-phosphate O-acyltransferase PlsY (EC 2.3.1.n3), partial [hydrothermal vent metagenome]
DVAKGFLASWLMARFVPVEWTAIQIIYIQILAGFLAVIGHVYPVFASFRGGKGVATLLGMGIALFPNVIWVPVAVFLIVTFGSGYVSLGSMLGGISFPLADILLYHDKHPGKVIFSVVVALFLLYTHRQNIRRLWRGNENRFKRIKKA